MSHARRPAGTRAGGQFAPSSRTEADVDLDSEPTWRDPDVRALSLLIDDTDLTPEQVVERAAADPLSALPRPEVEERIGAILHARDQAARWEADPDGETLHDAPPDDLPLDLAEWTEWNEPDRPDENGYTGYNLAGFTAALVTHYDDEHHRLRTQAIEKNRASMLNRPHAA